jgi:hypothetical protein
MDLKCVIVKGCKAVKGARNSILKTEGLLYSAILEKV